MDLICATVHSSGPTVAKVRNGSFIVPILVVCLQFSFYFYDEETKLGFLVVGRVVRSCGRLVTCIVLHYSSSSY